MANSKPYIMVVGIDYSDAGRLALEYALQTASERAPAEVHALHVVPMALPGLAADNLPNGASTVGSPSMMQAVERLSAYLTEVAGRGLPGASRVVAHVRFDSAAPQLAQLAVDLDADVVIVGTHGRRGVKRLLLGSVAEAIVRLAPCPVLVMRPKTPQEELPQIEPPCPRCVETRVATGGAEIWCEQHRERHGQRHTYYQSDRVASETNLPMTFRP